MKVPASETSVSIETTETVTMGDSLKNAEKIRILVLGDSGVGKTSLVLPRMCVCTCASGERGILHKSAVC